MATISRNIMDAIITLNHPDPHSVLGPHFIKAGDTEKIVVRAYIPEAETLSVVATKDNSEYYMNKIHPEGLFEVIVDSNDAAFMYKLKKQMYGGYEDIFYDSYAFPSYMSDFDMYLYSQGNHHRIYEKLGAHAVTHMGVKGIHFSVWAPNAQRVSVIGDFNGWDGRKHVMRILGSSGVWEIFIPAMDYGCRYKFEIRAWDGGLIEKADPYAFFTEFRPNNCSIVYDLDGYQWEDEEWMNQRAVTNWHERPVNIYEVHLGSWMRVPEEGNRFLTYIELAHRLANHVKNMNYTHIEILPVSEHPFDGSWGYQVSGYYSVTSRFGNPHEFMYFVDYMHKNGIGIIMDWVPAHFPKDWHGLGMFDGTHLYEHEDPRMGEHKDWNTFIFNYGKKEVKNFLVANALFWLDKYHIDGLRVDAVASMLYLDYSRQPGEWIPNQYGGRENLEAIEMIRDLNYQAYTQFPGIMTIAEESTAWPAVSKPIYAGGLGFGFKWNMGWMHDTLKYMAKDPVYRKFHHNWLTFSIMYAFTENFMLVFSHDEVVHLKKSMLGKMPGDIWQKFANLRLLYGYMIAHPGKKVLFMGGEIGQWNEWNHDLSLDWHLCDAEPHARLIKYVSDLNYLYKENSCLWEIDFDGAGFEWIDLNDTDNSIIIFMRKGKTPNDVMIFALNFTPVPKYNYRIGVPVHAHYSEVLNSDSEEYWGSNVGNCGGFHSDEIEWQGRPYSLNVKLPPLGIVAFKPNL